MGEIIAATDGSALGNPGPAGWAWYIDESRWAAGGWEHATNNMGELKAVLSLFEATAGAAEHRLVVYCDSKYVIDALTRWMPAWKKRGWKKRDGKPVLNRDLLEALGTAMSGRDYKFMWVKGHAGHPLNEAADRYANAAARAYREGKLPENGPGFGQENATAQRGNRSATALQTSAVATAARAQAAEETTAPQSSAGEPAATKEPVVQQGQKAQEPNPAAAQETIADTADTVEQAHLAVEEFTESDAARAKTGFDRLKAAGVLKPASAFTSPDPQKVTARKALLAEAAERANTRDGQLAPREQPQDANTAPAAEEASGQAANQQTPPHVSAPETDAFDPDEALAAEEELETYGASMSENEIVDLLDERLVWITATGRRVDRANTITYRTRAFAAKAPAAQSSVQVVDAKNVLVITTARTMRGPVQRTSLWHYSPESSGWRLRFRQESPASAAE